MHINQFLIDTVILLSAAVLVIPLCLRLRTSPVLGYLLTGILVGPQGMGLISNIAGTRLLAEFGVVFLMFVVGLELSLQRLRVMRRLVFGLGFGQVALTSFIIGIFVFYFIHDSRQALVIGGAFALSSTAIVVQLLRERQEFSTRAGRTAFAILLFQDLAVVPLIVLIPLLGAMTGLESAGLQAATHGLISALAIAALHGAVAIILIMTVGNLILPPFFALAARAIHIPEFFTALVLLVALGVALLTEMAGLSMALGSFLAGLLLSGSIFRHQVEADITPFTGLLLGLFFITVGMTVDLQIALQEWQSVLAGAGALILLKIIIITPLCRLFGLSLIQSFRVSLILAQVGEFAFMLTALALKEGVFSADFGQYLLAVVSITMLLTPFLMEFGKRLSDRYEPSSLTSETRQSQINVIKSDTPNEEKNIIIAGFGRVGQTVARMMIAVDHPYIALDLRSDLVAASRQAGYRVFFGNCGHADVLRAAGIDQACALILTLDDLEQATRIVERLQRSHPRLPIYARATNSKHRQRLLEMGAQQAVPETLESSLRLAALALHDVGHTPDQIDLAANELRGRGDGSEQESNSGLETEADSKSWQKTEKFYRLVRGGAGWFIKRMMPKT